MSRTKMGASRCGSEPSHSGSGGTPIGGGRVETIGDVQIYRPTHYARWKIEPITFIMGNAMEYWRGAIIKYACRAGGKAYDGMDATQSEIADLEKARRYCEMRINQLRGKDVL